MARTPNPQRKPALMDDIVDFLMDKPLSVVSFRTLAAGLGVSTYTLVYHFGTRAELVRDIVRAISARQDAVVAAVALRVDGLDSHLHNLRVSWALSLEARNQQLQRLEFEAAIFEARETGSDDVTPTVFERWHRAGVDALIVIGLSPTHAEVESRLLVSTIYGLHYDVIVTRNSERASALFARAVDDYERRVRLLLDTASLGLDPFAGTSSDDDRRSTTVEA